MFPIPNSNLKNAIKQAGLTQARLSYLLGIDEGRLSKVINGYKQASKREAESIAYVLDKNIEELFPSGFKEA